MITSISYYYVNPSRGEAVAGIFIKGSLYHTTMHSMQTFMHAMINLRQRAKNNPQLQYHECIFSSAQIQR